MGVSADGRGVSCSRLLFAAILDAPSINIGSKLTQAAGSYIFRFLARQTWRILVLQFPFCVPAVLTHIIIWVTAGTITSSAYVKRVVTVWPSANS